MYPAAIFDYVDGARSVKEYFSSTRKFAMIRIAASNARLDKCKSYDDFSQYIYVPSELNGRFLNI